MKIANEAELFAEIDKVFSSVESKTRNNEKASVYLDLYNKLISIKKLVDKQDFSLESKKACDMSGPLANLYGGSTAELPKLGETLCAINDYYQGARIQTLSENEAKEFFLKA